METAEKNQISVVLSDDHPLLMDGFSNALVEFGIAVIGKTTVAEEVIGLYETLSPDVIVLDVRFGEDRAGIDTAKDLIEKYPRVKIIFLSQFEQIHLAKETYKMGALAYLTKTCKSEELATAIKRAAHGETYYLPHISEQLLNLSLREDDSVHSQLHRLTDRELKIFICMARGLTAAEMAHELNLSLTLINTASQTIRSKLGAKRPADITRLAIKEGYLEA